MAERVDDVGRRVVTPRGGDGGQRRDGPSPRPCHGAAGSRPGAGPSGTLAVMDGMERRLGGWPGLRLGRDLVGGVRNRARLGAFGGRSVVVRQSGRCPEALEWELDLLEHLTDQGLLVPRVVPTDDGRRHAGRVAVQEFLDGDPPSTSHESRLVVDRLRIVHDSTVGWPQRPGFASSHALCHQARGGDVCLDLMPDEIVQAVRRAWQQVQIGPESVVHGDLGASNLLVDGDAVSFLDWDEAGVDVR